MISIVYTSGVGSEEMRYRIFERVGVAVDGLVPRGYKIRRDFDSDDIEEVMTMHTYRPTRHLGKYEYLGTKMPFEPHGLIELKLPQMFTRLHLFFLGVFYGSKVYALSGSLLAIASPPLREYKETVSYKCNTIEQHIDSCIDAEFYTAINPKLQEILNT
jgi:hypothetical protein